MFITRRVKADGADESSTKAPENFTATSRSVMPVLRTSELGPQTSSTAKPYSVGKTHALRNDEIVRALQMAPEVPGMISPRYPQKEFRGACYIVRQQTGHPDDIQCDQLGVWDAVQGSTNFLAEMSNYSVRILKVAETPIDPDDVYSFKRRTYFHKKINNLKRVLVVPIDGKSDLCFIQYWWAGDETVVAAVPHGSATKNLRPFNPTMKSTSQLISSGVKSGKGPSQVHQKFMDRIGGLTGAQYSSQIPQPARVKSASGRNFRTKSPYESLLEKAIAMPTRFIQELCLYPEQTVICYTARRASDMAKFCTNPDYPSVLSIDTTFSVCDQYATLLTYRHGFLLTQRGNTPVFLGMSMFHQQAPSYRVYHKLGSEMARCNGTKGFKPRFSGMDGCKMLFSAIQATNPGVEILICGLHVPDNLTDQGRKSGMEDWMVKQVCNDVFGVRNGNNKIAGLVDFRSDEEFGARLHAVVDKWKAFGPAGNRFAIYFLKNKADLIKNHMGAEVRRRAGLGNNMYYTNDVENQDSVVKRDLEANGTIFEAVNTASELVARQNNTIELAALTGGTCVLAPAYEHLKLGDSLFWRLSEEKRTKWSGDIHKAHMKKSRERPWTTHIDSQSSIPPKILRNEATPSHSGKTLWSVVAGLAEEASRSSTITLDTAYGESDREMSSDSVQYSGQKKSMVVVSSDADDSMTQPMDQSADMRPREGPSFDNETPKQTISASFSRAGNSKVPKSPAGNRKGRLDKLLSQCAPKTKGRKGLRSTQKRKGKSGQGAVEAIVYDVPSAHTPSAHMRKGMTGPGPLEAVVCDAPSAHTREAKRRDESTDASSSFVEQPERLKRARQADRPNPSGDEIQVYKLDLCSKSTKICYGCKQQKLKLELQRFRAADDAIKQDCDLVAVALVQRAYFDKEKREEVKSAFKSNAYFHLEPACMKASGVPLIRENVILADFVRDRLDKGQYTRYQSFCREVEQAWDQFGLPAGTLGFRTQRTVFYCV